MHRRIAVAFAVVAVSAIGIAGCKKEEKKTEVVVPPPSSAQPTAPGAVPAAPTQQAPSATGSQGEALYKKYCVACHPNGGNSINPKKGLSAADMKANNITKPEDVVKVMRNPGPGMNKFDETMINDQDAMAIGEYIFATYNK